jgi:hypothetical protein
MEAWEELIFDGASAAGIAPNLPALAALDAVTGALAARRLRGAVTG